MASLTTLPESFQSDLGPVGASINRKRLVSLRRLRSGYVRCSGKNVLRGMQACFLRACLEMNNARPVGCAPRQLAILDLGGNRRSWGAGIGMLMLCATSSATI